MSKKVGFLALWLGTTVLGGLALFNLYRHLMGV